MAARLEEPNATQDDISDGEFAIQQLNQRHAARDNITPTFVAEYFCSKLGCSRLESLLFNDTDRFVRPFGRFPGIAEKPVAFQAPVRKGAHFGHAHHRLGRLWGDV
jgi:hypothetical protein